MIFEMQFGLYELLLRKLYCTAVKHDLTHKCVWAVMPDASFSGMISVLELLLS